MQRSVDKWPAQGLIGHFAARLAILMVVTIGSGAGISILKAYSGMGAGMLLDATSSSMFASCSIKGMRW